MTATPTPLRELLDRYAESAWNDGVDGRRFPSPPTQQARESIEAALSARQEEGAVVRRGDGRGGHAYNCGTEAAIVGDCTCGLDQSATPPASGEAGADAYSDFTRAELIGLLETAYDQLIATPPAASGEKARNVSAQVRAVLLWVLWHHQGGSSPVGQPIRAMLGIGQHDHLTENEVDEAKFVADRLAAVAPAGMDEWQPIETAPKDGSRILCWDGRWATPGVYVEYDCLGWQLDAYVDEPHHIANPTHWMPLPTPPATAGKE